jgi:hypothetical protein
MSRRNSLLSGTMLSGVGGVFLATLSGQVVCAQSLSNVFDKAGYAYAAPNLPAVDGVNGKIAAFGGGLNPGSFYSVNASLQVPLGHSYGFQIDPRVGSVGGNLFGGAGAHLFWRDPSVALFGLYVRHLYLDRLGGVHATSVAAEGEYYLGRWTIQGVAGVEFGNSTSQPSTSATSAPIGGGIIATTTTTSFAGYDVKTRFFDQVNVKYYMRDNWAGYFGHRYLGGKHAFALGTEFVVPLASDLATTAFIEGRAGQGETSGAWAGLKFYFGHKGKSLIQRHRENDDPPDWEGTPTLFNSATSSSTMNVVCTEIGVGVVPCGGGGGEGEK